MWGGLLISTPVAKWPVSVSPVSFMLGSVGDSCTCMLAGWLLTLSINNEGSSQSQRLGYQYMYVHACDQEHVWTRTWVEGHGTRNIPCIFFYMRIFWLWVMEKPPICKQKNLIIEIRPMVIPAFAHMYNIYIYMHTIIICAHVASSPGSSQIFNVEHRKMGGPGRRNHMSVIAQSLSTESIESYLNYKKKK